MKATRRGTNPASLANLGKGRLPRTVIIERLQYARDWRDRMKPVFDAIYGASA